MILFKMPATVIVASRRVKHVVCLNRRLAHFQRIANQLLDKSIKRFVGGKFQRMSEQTKAEVGIQFFGAGVGSELDVGQMVVKSLWFQFVPTLR